MIGRNIYAREALSQIPRILSMQDRNPSSDTHGCFYRIYWHDKATDIASSHVQVSALALALAYANRFPGSAFFRKQKIKEWCAAGMDFWSRIQKPSGCFDEHYPNEQSFGATAWTLYGVIDSYIMLKNELGSDFSDRMLEAILKSARWLARNDEPLFLANHQAIAAYCMYRAYQLSGDGYFRNACDRRLIHLFSSQSKEGWFMEYDGCDLGYLTTTISFLGKIYRNTKDRHLMEKAGKAIGFAQYFVFPDATFAGIGSRHTAHFHPHGFEVFAGMPAARAAADKMLEGFASGKAVTPAVMDDKYFSTMVIELLLSYLDFSPKKTNYKLPFEGAFRKYFPDSGMLVAGKKKYYLAANLKKGGIMKISDKAGKKSFLDLGVSSSNGKALTSNWLDENSKISLGKDSFSTEGWMRIVPKGYLSSMDMILSRLYFKTAGRNYRLAFSMKKHIIKKLITESRKSSTRFARSVKLEEGRITIEDTADARIFSNAQNYSRYVPASRYFQIQELNEVFRVKETGSGGKIKREIDV